ncbi:hypothetical protein PMIN01_12648 [Paraphaeosphaeria minitans]|uniref:Uncharacterized protein n=1 Tax=Paraphaeosphaeria minitans TaxID=565426 RepID=A0A9P6G592_9PLEO|nr:hypothetical protein PMIN01_12648 [Paraphaeosphaeria minitans]
MWRRGYQIWGRRLGVAWRVPPLRRTTSSVERH